MHRHPLGLEALELSALLANAGGQREDLRGEHLLRFIRLCQLLGVLLAHTVEAALHVFRLLNQLLLASDPLRDLFVVVVLHQRELALVLSFLESLALGGRGTCLLQLGLQGGEGGLLTGNTVLEGRERLMYLLLFDLQRSTLGANVGSFLLDLLAQSVELLLASIALLRQQLNLLTKLRLDMPLKKAKIQ